MYLPVTALFFLVFSVVDAECKVKRPNIVFMIADDLGWNDVSFHGSDQIPTPNIDLLAYSGVALGRYYSHAICTPSRSALLSGKYSHRIGMQGLPLGMSEDRGIPLNVTLLPQYLRSAGYKTHLVGKWHVGASRTKFLPTNRGFDTHFGHRGGYMDYYEYMLRETFNTSTETTTEEGMTLFDGMRAAWDVEGYITDVYTDRAISIIENHNTSKPLFLMVAHNAPHAGDVTPLQAPPEEVRKFHHVELLERRIYAAMVKIFDDSVGKVVQSLQDKNMLDNTIIVFVSDNGGVTTGVFANTASNYPLRGLKMTPFEGGVRVAGLIWAKGLKNSNNYWDGYMHVTDWLPTLLTAAGVEVPSNIDGINQWENINSNSNSDRSMMYEIDDYSGYASITHGEFKLITGTVTQKYSTYQGADLRGIIGKVPSYKKALKKSIMYGILNSLEMEFNITVRNNMVKCSPSAKTDCLPNADTMCLYNIIKDPCETTDLSADYPDLVETMMTLLDTEASKRIPRVKPVFQDPLSKPRLHNYTWAPWIVS